MALKDEEGVAEALAAAEAALAEKEGGEGTGEEGRRRHYADPRGSRKDRTCARS